MCLNDTVDLPDEMLENYTFVSCNSPSNTKRGIGLFYKNDLPVKIRTDLSFEESIVIEVVFSRKKVFFTAIYKSPSYCHGTPEFELFLNNFEALYENIKKDNPFAFFLQVTSMVILSFGGMMVIPMPRVKKSNN